MGLVYSRLKLMLKAKNNGASFENVVMIGRQKINLSKNEFDKIKKGYCSNIVNIDYDFGKRVYADAILKECLDIEELNIIDYSNYEGANILVDINDDIPDNLNNKFDALIDGGTIEHIFNFPVAIKNYMRLIKCSIKIISL